MFELGDDEHVVGSYTNMLLSMVKNVQVPNTAPTTATPTITTTPVPKPVFTPTTTTPPPRKPIAKPTTRKSPKSAPKAITAPPPIAKPTTAPSPIPKPPPLPIAKPTTTPPPLPEFVDPDLNLAVGKVKGQCSRQFCNMFEIIMKNVGRGHAVILNTPDGMYPEPCIVSVPLTEVAQVFTHDWLDSSILHWFAMHLYEFPKNMHCAVLDPFLIDATKCLFQPDEVVSHITKVAEHHKQRRFLLVPYIQSAHWCSLLWTEKSIVPTLLIRQSPMKLTWLIT